MPEEQKKNLKSLIFIATAGLLFFLLIFKILKFWNLKQDLNSATIGKYYNPAFLNDLSFFKGLTLPEPSDDLLYSIQDAPLALSEAQKESFLALVPDYNEKIDDFLQRIPSGAALISQPVEWEKIEFDFNKPFFRRYSPFAEVNPWQALIFSVVGRRTLEEIAGLYNGLLQTGFHIELETRYAPDALGSFYSLWNINRSVQALIDHAPVLPFSLNQAKNLARIIQGYEKRIPPFKQIVRRDYFSMKKIIQSFKAVSVPGYDLLTYRWPETVFHEVVTSDSFLQLMEKELYEPLLQGDYSRWQPDSKPLQMIKEKKERSRQVEGMRKYLILLKMIASQESQLLDVYLMFSIDFSALNREIFAVRTKMRMAQVALAIYCYHREKDAWPPSLEELETWWGAALPEDLFAGAPFMFKAGSPPDVRSVGPDCVSGTDDDFLFNLHSTSAGSK